jgi:peptide/nickel transport system substrate-binding protein
MNPIVAKKWRFLSPLLVVGLVAAACGDSKGTASTATVASSATSAGAATTVSNVPVAGGSATVLLYSDIATLDPVKGTGSSGSDGQQFHALYGGLLGYDASKNVVEGIQAESFKPKGTDYASWQLKLKSGLKFTDGTAFTAASVKANWEREQDAANACPCRGTVAGMKSMTVVDPLTLDIVLATPNAHMDKLIERQTTNYIASEKAIADKVDMTSKAVGAGPFTLDQWIRDDRMVMSRNPDWLGGKAPVYLDKLTFRVILDEGQRVDTFTTGQADAFFTSTPSSITQATKAVKDSSYISVGVTTGQVILMNNSVAPFNDVRVRNAVAQGIDLAALAKDVLGGATPATHFTVKGTPFHDEKAVLPKYDLVAAQKNIDAYVAEKNSGQPIKFTILAAQQSTDQARVKFWQTSLGQLKNIQVTIQTDDDPTKIGKVLQGQYQAASWGVPILEPEPGLFSAVKTGLFTNFSKYSNPDVDKALDAARVTIDTTERKKLYDIVWEALARDLPYLPYVEVTNGFVVNPKVKDAKLYTDGILRYDLLWIKK